MCFVRMTPTTPIGHSAHKLARAVVTFTFLFASSAKAESALDALAKKYGQTEDVKAKQTDIVEQSKEEAHRKKRVKKQPAAESQATATEEKSASVTAALSAQDPTAPPPASTEPQSALPESAGLLGTWGGAKPWLAKKGIRTGVVLKTDLVRVFSGGNEQRGANQSHLDLYLGFDLQTLTGLKGTSLNLHGIGDYGDRISPKVGDTQGTSNIDAPSTGKLFEIYLEQKLDDRLAVQLGTRDLNTEFLVTDSSADFLNGSFGVTKTLSQTGVNGPSIFPNSSLAMLMKYEAPTGVYSRNGIFNAQAGDPSNPWGTQITNSPDVGFLGIQEIGFKGEEGSRLRKFGVGIWAYTKAVRALKPDKSERTNWGHYVILDYGLTSKLSIFARAGWAEPIVNNFAFSAEYGLLYSGLFAASDALGLASATAQSSQDFIALNGLDAAETTIEFFYRVSLWDGVRIKPDYQYVVDPAANPAIANASVGTLRAEIEF